MGTFRYVKGFVLEPFLGIFVVPAFILIFTEYELVWYQAFPLNILFTGFGIFCLVTGLILVSVTTFHFAKHGEGSAAPWDPPVKLVAQGFYQYTRNPMVLGVLFTVLGESVVFGSSGLLLLFIALWIGNHILFVRGEESELTAKFGDEYIQYMKNVPRWIPRRTPWKSKTDD